MVYWSSTLSVGELQGNSYYPSSLNKLTGSILKTAHPRHQGLACLRRQAHCAHAQATAEAVANTTKKPDTAQEAFKPL